MNQQNLFIAFFTSYLYKICLGILYTLCEYSQTVVSSQHHQYLDNIELRIKTIPR